MVDITEISAVVTAAGVLIGIVYYILEMRHQTRLREMDLVLRVDDKWMYKVEQSWLVIYKTKLNSFADFEEKCLFEANQVAGFFDGLGLLLRRGLVDIDMISGLFILEFPWQKMKLFVEGVRDKDKDPRVFINFEYLYNEWKKREKKAYDWYLRKK